MKKDLTLLIPTRGRPQNFLRAVDTALEHSDVDVIAYVDEDDPELRQYTAPCHRKTHIMVGPRIGTAASLKKLIAVCETEWMMLGSDDIVFDTPGWAEKLIKALPEDQVGISFGEDKHERQCNHPTLHRKLYELMGLWPDVFWHFGPDGYLGKVIEAVSLKRRVYVREVVIRHLQAKAGKSKMDQTFYDARSKGVGTQDMKKAMEFFDRDVSILKAEVERCKSLTSSV